MVAMRNSLTIKTPGHIGLVPGIRRISPYTFDHMSTELSHVEWALVLSRSVQYHQQNTVVETEILHISNFQ